MKRQAYVPMWYVLIALLAGNTPSQVATATIRSDFDHDCDVDAADLTHLGACTLGPSVPQTDPACANVDLDGDQDVDLTDFGIFQRCYSSEGYAADPNCDPP